MQKEHDINQELNVDVHTRAIRAARRANGANRGMSEPLQMPEVFKTQGWLSNLLPHTEKLLVNGRQITGFVIPHWAAGVLLAAVLSGMGFMYSKISDQRDMLIEMKTELRLAKEHDNEYRDEFKTRINVQSLQIDVLNKDLAAIRVILTPQQLRMLERSRKVDN